MIDELLSLLTRQNITLALSIFGSLGTIMSWTHNFITNRKNLNVSIIGQRYTDKKSILLYMMFENKSRLPIAITNISIRYSDILYSCHAVPITALEETTRCGKEIISHHEYTSLPMPIVITGLGGTSGYVYFEFPEVDFQPDATHLNFVINTNRGKAIQKTLLLGRQLH